jgi:endonuclease III
MLLRKRADKIRKILRTRYPHVKTQLTHRNAFELLIATILSAQCTDVQVNRVTPKLFEKFPTPADFANAPISAIEASIHATGFYRNKAKNIQNCCKALLENYQGRVPDRLEALTTLPGVGRKTANVVRGAAFGIPGMVVDTHVARISQRLALTGNSDPVKIEFDLMEIIPTSAWNDFSLHLIYFGREICSARRPLCNSCPVRRYCPYPGKSAS